MLEYMGRKPDSKRTVISQVSQNMSYARPRNAALFKTSCNLVACVADTLHRLYRRTISTVSSFDNAWALSEKPMNKKLKCNRARPEPAICSCCCCCFFWLFLGSLELTCLYAHLLLCLKYRVNHVILFLLVNTAKLF